MTFKKASQKSKMISASDERFFHLMFEGHSAVMLLIEPKTGAILDANQTAVDFYGYPKSKLCGMMIHEINTLPSQQVTAEFQRALNEKRNYFVFSHRLASGEERIVEVYSSPIALQEKQVLFSIIHDITERERAENGLRESEAALKQAQRVAHVGSWVWHIRENRLEWSDEMYHIFGYEKDSFSGRLDEVMAQAIHPDDRAEVERLNTSVVVDKKPIPLEYRVIRPDQTIRTVWAEAGQLILDEDGNPSILTGIVQDITERKQADNALRESEDKFKYIFDYSVVGKSITYPGGEVHVNKAFCDMLDYSAEEMQGRKWQEITHPDDIEFTQSHVDLLLSGKKESTRFVKRFIHKNGSIVWVDLSSTMRRDEQNKPLYLMSTIMDVTEHKQAEEALKENEAIFSSFLEHSPVYVFFKDKDIRSLRLSKNYEQMLGMQISDLLGKTMDDLFPTDLAKSMVADDLRILNEGKRITVEEELNGHIYETTKFPVFKDGNPYILAGFTLDITERKQAEQALLASEAMLRKVQVVAHMGSWEIDLNTKTVVASDEAHRIYGMSQGSMTLAYVKSVPLPEFRPILDAALTALITEGKRYDVEFKIRRQSDGSVRDVHSIAEYNAARRTIIGSIQDITDRKQVEEALRKSEECLRLAVSAGRMGTWDRNFLSGQLDWSVECKAMFGMAPEGEMNDERFLNALHPEDRVATDLAILEALEKRTDFDMEYRVVWPDGTIHWIAAQGHGYYNEAGLAIHMAGITFDITARKQAEEALRKSEALYRQAIEVAGAVPYLQSYTGSDKRLHYDFIGEGIRKMTGYGPEEFNVDLWDSLTQERFVLEDLAEYSFDEAIERVRSGENSIWKCNHCIRARDGSIHWVFEAAVELRDEHGVSHGSIGTFQDITERKQAEEALRESEVLYRQAIEVANAVPYHQIYHVNGNAIDVEYDFIGEGIRQITGYGPEEFNGYLWDSLIQESILLDELVEYSWSDAAQRVRSGLSPVWKCNHRIRARDGSIHWVFEAAVELRNENGVSHGSIGTFQDITERKQAEEALRENEERYRTVVSNTPVVTFVTDEKGIFTLSEGKGLLKLGLQPGQVVGLSVFDVYCDYPGIVGAMKNALAGHSQRDEVEMHGIVFDVFYSPVFDQHGKVVKVIGVSNDVTERKRAEEEIRQLNLLLEQRVVERTVQLETANRELEAFSYSVSHDLRAPLRGIDGWSQALLEDYHDQLDEQGRQYIERVRSETQRMGHLIDDMLKLSRLTRAELVKEQVDLSALAHSVAERLKRSEPQHQADFNIQAGITAEGDSHLLEAALVNLLENAFKFTAKCAEARIEFGETELEDQRVFFVRDNGAGFDMAYSQKLFGAFQRMHKTSEFPGTGIGLATVQRVIHRHGGRVWAEAEVDRGAVFYFTLGPLSPALSPRGERSRVLSLIGKGLGHFERG